ncbi:MAG: hypothetical protein SWJ54_09575 [Cyanobacteriota bacterium]|nr:hypothetical protein [Cyanobacteriota bacterium]
MQDGVECPKCGKHTIVQRNPDVFQCLNCDFQRDLSRGQYKDKSRSSSSTKKSSSGSYGGSYSSSSSGYSSSGGGYSKAEYREENSEGGLMGFLIVIATIAIFIL